MKASNGIFYYIRITGVLLLICGIIAGLLGVVDSVTKDRIAENKQKEINEKISALFEGEVEKTDVEGSFEEGVNNVWSVQRDGNDLGYCFSVSTRGYGGDIEMLIGIDPFGSVFGIQIADMSGETAGLGTRIAGASFLSQYNLKTEELAYGDVDVITGSTVSSKAVTDGVNLALRTFKEVKG
ncbi:MAG: FMN-binding protein [Clostridia bacterium]|nr:FMN-binding protein [Clostridia bacterium]